MNNSRFNPNFSIKYPNIIVKYDDEVANTFFSYVISGDVNKLNQYVTNNSIPISIKKEKDGYNALHLAVESSLSVANKLNLINYLILNYIPINDRDSQGNTPLLMACKKNEIEIVDLLLKNNANPSIKNMFGITPLHYAAGGSLGSCEDIKLDSIIEEPSSKEFSDMEINEFSKSIKDLYQVMKTKYGNLGNVELRNIEKDYPNRITDYLSHIKYLIRLAEYKYEETKSLFNSNKQDLLSEYKRILSIKNKNPDELLKDVVNVRNKYIDDFVEVIQKMDEKILFPLDLQSMEQIGDDNDTGLFLQNSTNDDINVKDYYKIDGSMETLDQRILSSYKETSKIINGIGARILQESNNYLNIINSETDPSDLIFQIKNSGQQMQKLELFQNIERLREYGINVVYNDYKKINPGTTNTNLFTAYKNILKTDTAAANNFNLTPLDQSIDANMVSYIVKSGAGAGAGFDLTTFNENIATPTNTYVQDILNKFTYNDYNPFTDARGNSKPIEINFRFPVSMLFSDSNNKPGISGVATALNTYWDNGNKQIFSLRKGNNWEFTPSNGCHNVKKIKLEYKNLTDVKITLTYLILIGGDGGSLVEKTVSSDFIRDVRIVFLQRTSNLNNVTLPRPWIFNGLDNIQNKLTTLDMNTTLVHTNPSSIKLSFNITGKIIYGNQYIYSPLYAFHKDIKDRYITSIQENFDQITKFELGTADRITLNTYNVLVNRTIETIRKLYRFHTRYLNMSNTYNQSVVEPRLSKISQITEKLNSKYPNSELLTNMVSDINSTQWDFNVLNTKIEGNLNTINILINELVSLIRKINDLNKIGHYWHSDKKDFQINRTLDDQFNANFTLLDKRYNSNTVEGGLINHPTVTVADVENIMIGTMTITNDVNPLYELKTNVSEVRGIEFSDLNSGTAFDFTQPDYLPLADNIIPNYAEATRFRIIEELLLYIYHNKDTDKLDGKIKNVYEQITTSIKDNFGVTKPEILDPLVLSIIGDFLDVRLINEVKKQILEAANESFMKLIKEPVYNGTINDIVNDADTTVNSTFTTADQWQDGHPKNNEVYALYYPTDSDFIDPTDSDFIGYISTADNTVSPITFTMQDPNITLTVTGGDNVIIKLKTTDLSPITFEGTNIDPLALDLDVPFELDLNSLDQNVKDTIKNKLKNVNPTLMQILNKGDKLVIDPEFKYYEHISDNSSAKDQQIYYSTGFLDNTSENMCIKYDDGLLLKILKKYPNINSSDMYGNTPLLYAIKTNNYLAIKTLLSHNAKVLFKNNDGITPLHYVLDKLKNICEYFPDDNLITSINKSYIIGLKDELAKIDSSHNIMQNYDKLVLLYLFLYNSMAYTNLYANNYNLLIKFIELSKEELAKTFMEEDSDKKYKLLLVNPLYQFIEDDVEIKDSLKSKSKAYVRQNVPSVLLSNKSLLEEENKKLEKDIAKLNEKIAKMDEYKKLVEGNYQSNITEKQENITVKIDGKKKNKDENEKLLQEIEEIINNYKSSVNIDGLSLDFRFHTGNLPKDINNLINQNIIVSQLFKDDRLSSEDSKIYLSVLDKMLQSKRYGMSAYNVHSHLNKQMKNFVEDMEKDLNDKKYTIDCFNLNKEKCVKIKELVKETLSNHIFSKKSKSRKIVKNDKLNDIYKIICFTIDQVVGYSFYKVLFRLIMTYFSNILPKGTTDNDEYIKLIGKRTKTILENSAGQNLSVKNIVLPTYDKLDNSKEFEYKPSYLTKRMVSTICGIKLSEEYSEEDNDNTFNLIIELISANNVMPINSKSKIIKYLNNKICPYFKKYYTISIKTLNNLTSNYENMIQNQYVLLQIIDKLLETTMKGGIQLQVL